MDKTIFSKYSNDRGIKFRIRTDICLDSKGGKYVKKHPLTLEAQEHINHICSVYDGLKNKYGDIVGINECSLSERGDIIFPYICGHTLNEELNKLCQSGDKKSIIKLVDRYVNLVKYNSDSCFQMTKEFEEVFGNVNLSSELLCTDVADIDLIFENILVDGENWNIIDYEWTFLFPIPVNFIIYRGLAAFVEGLYSQSDKNLEGLNLYEYCGITSEEIVEYKKMIEGFEKYVMQGGDTMKALRGKIAQKIYNPVKINKIISNDLGKMGVQIFPDYGNGFDEEKSYFVEANIDNYGIINLDIDIDKDCCGYRIDPAMDYCILDIEKLEVDGVKWEAYSTNGFEYGKHGIVFDTEDSQLYVNNLLNAKKIHILAKIALVNKEIACEINNYTKYRLCEIEKINKELTEINVIAEERNQQILGMNKLAEEQNAKVADLYKQLENLYIEKNEMEQKYTEQIAELSKSNSELSQRNQEMNEKITDMQNTKVWKLYSKYQHMRDKNRV